MLDHPAISDVFELHRLYGSEPGAAALELTNVAAEALGVVNESIAWRQAKELDDLKKRTKGK